MKKIFLLIAVLFSVMGAVFAQEDPSVAETTVARVGTQMPKINVEMLDGTRTDNANLANNVVLITFWATWCPPCRKEMARAQADVVDRFAGKDFVFLPISRGEKRETVEEFVSKMGYTFPVALDTEKEAYSQFATNYVPRNFLVDKTGKIVLATAGYTPEEFDELLETIAKLL